MKHAKVKINGLKYVDCVGTIEFEKFYAEVANGDRGEADIVDFRYTKDPQTLAYQEEHKLQHMMRHLYNTYHTHAVYCYDCDSWKFGRGDWVFKSPCEDHDTITIEITAQYEKSDALALLRAVRDKFAKHSAGEHTFEIYMPDDHYTTNKNLAVIQFFHPSTEMELNDMVCWVADNCPELHFKMEQSTFVEVTNRK